ncbi:MAG: transporter [Austwickia sp.]|nr:transporter [Austwickia sp.]MBK8434981.1 transporter [Austwickia sp.]MBK9101461.1 transporter [Austwickia sp.]
MIAGIWVAAGLISLAVVIGLVRIATATDGASRAVVGDLVFFCAVALLILLGMLKESAAVVDAAMLASLLGILATVALARILTRGQR